MSIKILSAFHTDYFVCFFEILKFFVLAVIGVVHIKILKAKWRVFEGDTQTLCSYSFGR